MTKRHNLRGHTAKLLGHVALGGAAASACLCLGTQILTLNPRHSPSSPSSGNPRIQIPFIKSVTPQTKQHLSRLAVAMATPFSRSLQPGSLYNKWSLMDTAICVSGIKTRCPPVHTWRSVTSFHCRPIISELNPIINFHPSSDRWHYIPSLQAHRGTTLTMLPTDIWTQRSTDKWIGSIWMLINCMRRGGSSRFPLPAPCDEHSSVYPQP